MITAIVAIPKTEIDSVDAETATGLTAIMKAFGGSRTPWRDIDILAVPHYVYQFEIENENKLNPLEAIADAVIIAVIDASGNPSVQNPINEALFLEAMPDDSVDGLPIRPTVIRQVLVKHVANPIAWNLL